MLALKGFDVIMACRNLDKASKIRDKILKDNGAVSLEIMKIDMGSFKSIESFAKDFKFKYDKLQEKCFIMNMKWNTTKYALTNP